MIQPPWNQPSQRYPPDTRFAQNNYSVNGYTQPVGQDRNYVIYEMLNQENQELKAQLFQAESMNKELKKFMEEKYEKLRMLIAQSSKKQEFDQINQQERVNVQDCEDEEVQEDDYDADDGDYEEYEGDANEEQEQN